MALGVDKSAEIHRRARNILRACKGSAGQAGREQPPSSMAWLETDNITLLRGLGAHCVHVAACQHSMNVFKSWAMCASFPGMAHVACTCTHPPGTHVNIAGVKVDNQYLSTLTAEYPASLACSMAQLMLPFVTRLGHRRTSLRDFAHLLPEATISRRPTVCDGAGLNSTPNHTNVTKTPLCSA